VELASPVVRTDVIADAERAVAMADVARLETKVFSPRRTAWLLGTPIVLFGALIGVACSGGCGP
jgi:hypothetical protein